MGRCRGRRRREIAGDRTEPAYARGAGELGTRAVLPPPLRRQPGPANKNAKVARIGVVNGPAHAAARGTAGRAATRLPRAGGDGPRREKVFAAYASRPRRFFFVYRSDRNYKGARKSVRRRTVYTVRQRETEMGTMNYFEKTTPHTTGLTLGFKHTTRVFFWIFPGGGDNRTPME